MAGKQHTGFKHRLLAMLFLFFNCVCTAAPIIRTTSQEYQQAISLRLAQSPGTAETEEESRPVNVSFLNQYTHFSLRKHHCSRLYHSGYNNNTSASNEVALLKPSPGSESFLPRPGYYVFLFRYTLF